MSQSGSAPGAALGSAPVPQTAPARSGGVWRMLLAMALSGTIGLFVVESGLPPLLVVFGRCVLGGIGLAAWLGLRRQWVQLDRSDWLWLIVGGVALVLNWIALFTAYRYSSIAIATVVYHFQPFILLGLAALQGDAANDTSKAEAARSGFVRYTVRPMDTAAARPVPSALLNGISSL